MFKSQTARASRLPHLATVVALMFTIAVGFAQSPGSAADVAAADNASVANR